MQPDENPLVWPKEKDKARLASYAENDQLYKGDHFEAFSPKMGGEIAKSYKKLRYIVANFPGLMSRVLADMLFGENLSITVEDKKTQEFVNELIKRNDLINQLYESALINSRRGMDVFKIRIDRRNPSDPNQKPEVIIEQVGAEKYFPVFDNKNARNVVAQDVICTTFKEGQTTYLHKEIHVPGYIRHEIYIYDPTKQSIVSQVDSTQFGFAPEEATKVDSSLVYAIPNYRDGEFWGPSDYRDLMTLFYALNNRMTKVDNILDKHSDPILAVPVGVLDEDGKVEKSAFNMFEVDNENPGFNKPEYIVWNANLESAFTEIDKLLDMLFMFSEIAPATMGADKEGQAESGRALKFKLLSTIRKRNRKISYYDEAIKNMIKTSIELAKAWGVVYDGMSVNDADYPVIKWGDGVLNDQTEMVEIATQRIDNGTMSQADAIVYLDDIPLDKAKEKVEEIEKESTTPIKDVENNLNGDKGSGTSADIPPGTGAKPEEEE